MHGECNQFCGTLHGPLPDARYQVRVHVSGDRYRGMAEELGHNRDISPRGEQQRRVAVPQAVELDVGERLAFLAIFWKSREKYAGLSALSSSMVKVCQLSSAATAASLSGTVRRPERVLVVVSTTWAAHGDPVVPDDGLAAYQVHVAPVLRQITQSQ